MRTLASPGEAKLVRKRSRFFACALPVETEADADAAVAELRRRFHDARHLVYAYRVLDAGTVRARADDAGEPAGSAGRPLLQLLTGSELTNVVVAVARYFGGVKLGVGGLARAYRDAARAAVDAAGTVDMVPQAVVRVYLPHEHAGMALAAAARLRGQVVGQGYAGDMVLEISLPRDKLDALRTAVAPWGRVEEA
ncbi:MAG: YigZ family protein [Candidatus Bipolaricaulaceae bacterium]